MNINSVLPNHPISSRETLNSELPLAEKIMLESNLNFVSEKDQKGPTTDLFFHEIVENESDPKKIFEYIMGLLGFICFLITLPIFSLLILLTSGTPIFAKESLVGYRGKKYISYTYCTYKSSDKSTTTLLGKLLLATGGYKLPNFVNILNGDMGLVGLQPLSAEVSEELNKKFTDFYKRFATKPGLIEVKNGRSWDLDQHQEALCKSLEKELRYLVYPTLKKDLRVIIGRF